MKILIIGGGTAGSEVAWRLRRLNKEVEIVILEKGKHTQYSPCALPYLISGKIKNIDDIILFDQNFYNYNKIDLQLGADVKDIDSGKQLVKYIKNSKAKTINYDYLVLANGLSFNPLLIPGLEDCHYFKLKSLEDAVAIKKAVKKNDKALIIGAGYIGVELAEALSCLGLKVTIAEGKNHLLPAVFDKKMAEKISEEIEKKRVKIIIEAKIEKILKKEAQINGKKIKYDHLFVCCGLSADKSMALKAGVKCDKGIITDDFGKTSDKKIFAAGDLAESINLIDGKKTLSQLATTAVRQANVLAQNILGGNKKNEMVLNTSISKFGDLIFGASGVSQKYCQDNGIAAESAFYEGKTKAEYYPDAKKILTKIIALPNGEIIGCQIAGYKDIAGRLNMAALAIKQKLTLEELIASETCYNPAIAPIFDPLLLAAEICLKKIKAKHESS